MEPLSTYFADIDADFIGLKKASDEDYVYNATDVLVQSTWELPIVIQWPGSVVKFEFSCEPSDISFGVVFVAAPDEDQDVEELEIETIEEIGRVNSSQEPVSGSFEVPSEGVVFFMWDNNYDWTANKKLSYLIEVMQPCFTVIDELRTEKVLPLIKDVVEDLEVAFVRHADAQDCIEHSTADVNFLEEQLAALQVKLDAKYKEQDELGELMIRSEDMLDYGYAVEAGLCLRMLNKHCLSLVLSYLPLKGGANKVSKYWSNLMALNRRGLVHGAELVYREDKMSKSDINNALFQIRQNAAEIASKKAPTQASAKAPSNAKSSSGGKRKPQPGDSDYDSALDSEDSAARAKTSKGKAVAGPAKTTTTTGPKGINPALSVSFDNLLPAKGGPTNFTTPTHQIATPDPKKPAAAPSAAKQHHAPHTGVYKHHTPAPAAPAPPSHIEPVGKAPMPPPPPPTPERRVREAVGSPERKPASSSSQSAPVPSSSSPSRSAAAEEHRLRLTQYVESNNDRNKEDWSRNRLEPPAVAESKNRRRPKESTVAAPAASGAPSQPVPSKVREGRPAAEGEGSSRSRQLLQHVQKIRSDQQLNSMLEYIQAGFIKIETLNTEKRRIKKLIRAWNLSFERKNGRLPTSTERKGHLRELYEEYQQVSLGLRIRNDKMNAVLTSVGLDKESFEKLREKQNLVW